MFRKPEENHEVHDKHTADGVGTGPDPGEGKIHELDAAAAETTCIV